MKKLLFLSMLAAGLALSAPQAGANEAVRDVQAQLQGSGYYNGPLDGKLNPETKAALRRYQIRNELEPTGGLTPETLASLKRGGPTTPANPVPPSAPANVQANRAAVAADSLAGFFRGTPYADSSPEVKYNTLRKAQAILADRGLYQGEINGQPSPATVEALLRFQAQRGLAKTGRLDGDTLVELGLIPGSKVRRSQAEPQAPEPSRPEPPDMSRPSGPPDRRSGPQDPSMPSRPSRPSGPQEPDGPPAPPSGPRGGPQD